MVRSTTVSFCSNNLRRYNFNNIRTWWWCTGVHTDLMSIILVNGVCYEDQKTLCVKRRRRRLKRLSNRLTPEPVVRVRTTVTMLV